MKEFVWQISSCKLGICLNSTQESDSPIQDTFRKLSDSHASLFSLILVLLLIDCRLSMLKELHRFSSDTNESTSTVRELKFKALSLFCKAFPWPNSCKLGFSLKIGTWQMEKSAITD